MMSFWRLMFSGPREQVNQLTSFLDASHIYGNTKEDALDLRELTPGELSIKTTQPFIVAQQCYWHC